MNVGQLPCFYGIVGVKMKGSFQLYQSEIKFDLFQNNPNPFRGETTIGFTLPEATTATLTISDVNGKVVKHLNRDFVKGYNEIRLSEKDLGTYRVLWYELKTSTDKASRKMILLKQ